MTAIVGLDELVLVIGLVMLTVALWPVFERGALAVPGAVLVWIALPVRSPLIHRADPAAAQRRKRT